MTFESITNRGEFFSDHYLDARLAADLDDLRKSWDMTEGRGEATARSGLKGLRRTYFPARAAASEAGPEDHADAVRSLNDTVLASLGFTPARTEITLSRSGGTDELLATVAASVDTPTGLLLVAVDAGLATDVDELFDTDPRGDGRPGPGLLIVPFRRDGGRAQITAVADAPGEFFSIDDPPRFVLLCAGSTVLLAERSKWAEGRYLAVELEAALERADAGARGELETIAALFSADGLVPGHLASGEEMGTSFFDEVEDKATRHAVGVSKELREGMRRSVEILANEIIQQRLSRRLGVYEGENRVDPVELTKQCLRYLYRLIVLLYAESRPELGVLPIRDDAYLAGYSIDRLRELLLVELADEHAANGAHLDESLRLLFDLVNGGYHADHAIQELVFHSGPEGTGRARSTEEYLEFPGLDATIFDPGSTPLLDSVQLRNEALQQVLALLMLNRESKRKDDQRGFISYAQLGINQLGAVYEGLMAYAGFFAKDDLYEVAKQGDPSDGTWMVPVAEADEYPEEVFVKATDPITGRTDRVRHPGGSFVYRLAGRDRQRSASYYTPEVLTSSVVRHALAELLGTDDYARVPGGSAGISEARQILNLTICEPALGSGAFLNEAINQLSTEYLKRRQVELDETLDADRFQRELQKVKAHFALHQCYGVDLNATAVELAEVSLWLNCMYPGLRAPWFRLRLRPGNSLIGARRATWRTSQVKLRVWANDKAEVAVPPENRPLTEQLESDEIHHFLLPGNGWAAVAGRKEARELAPEQAKSLGAWRKTILKAPSTKDVGRLCALAVGVERLWNEAAELLDRLHGRMRRPLGLYGVDDEGSTPADDRRTAEAILSNPSSALGRLRLVMDAWVGLWFWTLDDDVTPPSWQEWLVALERIIGPEPASPTGQLDLFADLAAIRLADEVRGRGRAPIVEVLRSCPWLARAETLARREGAWHWELEFAPVFRAGGFALQVGNPPWVQLTWDPSLLVAETRPSVEVLELPVYPLSTAEETNLRDELPRQSAVDFMTSPTVPQTVPNGGSNLYRAFLGIGWVNAREAGVIGLLHPSGVLTDKGSAGLRPLVYRRLRRLYEFSNQLKLFEDIGNTRPYAIAVYGRAEDLPRFVRSSGLLHPMTLDLSFGHDGEGPSVGVKLPSGAWDLRPHASRIYVVDRDTLELMSQLLGESTNPFATRLMSLVLREELDALRSLSGSAHLSSADFEVFVGISEEPAVKAGNIVGVNELTNEVTSRPVLQSPHISVSNPVCQQTVLPYTSHRSYAPIDLETCEAFNRTTRYRVPAGAEETPLTPTNFAILYKRWCDPAGERTLAAALVPPRTNHLETAYSITLRAPDRDAALVGWWSSLPLDYFVKSLGVDNIRADVIRMLPWSTAATGSRSLLLRCLRLNCLTPDYEALWEEVFDPSWQSDRWTDGSFVRVGLGDVDAVWTVATPLRRDYERRLALVEVDALTAVMLGLTAEQLCAMYRTQFPVLRKYEYATAFDAEGRMICAHHQSAGIRQAQLQHEAKCGHRDSKWKTVWELYQQWEEDPGSVDWESQYEPPFTRPDREAEMTRAYNEFQRRLEAGEYL